MPEEPQAWLRLRCGCIVEPDVPSCYLCGADKKESFMLHLTPEQVLDLVAPTKVIARDHNQFERALQRRKEVIGAIAFVLKEYAKTFPRERVLEAVLA